MSRTWILVAESSRAKLYESDSKKEPLSEVEALVHPEGRMHEGDLVSDQQGTDKGGNGLGRHVMDNKTSARTQEHIGFAREIASRLEQARNKGSFDRLVLIAPPTFLGLLRDNLSKEVMDRVAEQVDKNLVQQPPHTIRDHLSLTVW